MNHKESLSGVDTWKNTPVSVNPPSNEIPPDHPSFSDISSLNQQKWEDANIFDYDVGMESQFQEFNQASESQSSLSCKPSNEAKILEKGEDQMRELQTLETYKTQEWDPRAMLSNLSFLEQKIHHLQDLVHVIVGQRSRVIGQSSEIVFQQQQLITADLTSIIIQLVSTAGSLLPSARNLSSVNPSMDQLGSLDDVFIPADGSKFPELSHQIDQMGNDTNEQKLSIEEHELKDEEDVDEGENLPLGSYEILQLEKEEILAPHTHFCTICGKGFKRDANLRMHMRGHGDEYKTPAALAKPVKEPSSESVLIKRYSCPYSGCKRNRDHKKFQPLKTILCVKNHYKRTHCDKSYICSKCNTKKFSVIADLKTHEKHCGRDKWLCSCGTTFSRKDKLFGHITLFQGHTPAIMIDESKGMVGPTDRVDSIVSMSRVGSGNFNFGSLSSVGNEVDNIIDVKGVDDPTTYFSPLNFDPCSIAGFHEFPRPSFNDSESSFSYLLQGSKVKH